MLVDGAAYLFLFAFLYLFVAARCYSAGGGPDWGGEVSTHQTYGGGGVGECNEIVVDVRTGQRLRCSITGAGEHHRHEAWSGDGEVIAQWEAPRALSSAP